MTERKKKGDPHKRTQTQNIYKAGKFKSQTPGIFQSTLK